MTTNALYPNIGLRFLTGLLDAAGVDWYAQAVKPTAAFDRADTVLGDLGAVLAGDPVALLTPAVSITATAVEVTCDDSALDLDSLLASESIEALVVYADDGSSLWLAAWYGRKRDSTPVAGTSDGTPAPLTWPTTGAFLRIPC